MGFLHGLPQPMQKACQRISGLSPSSCDLHSQRCLDSDAPSWLLLPLRQPCFLLPIRGTAEPQQHLSSTIDISGNHQLVVALCTFAYNKRPSHCYCITVPSVKEFLGRVRNLADLTSCSKCSNGCCPHFLDKWACIRRTCARSKRGKGQFDV